MCTLLHQTTATWGSQAEGGYCVPFSVMFTGIEENPACAYLVFALPLSTLQVDASVKPHYERFVEVTIVSRDLQRRPDVDAFKPSNAPLSMCLQRRMRNASDRFLLADVEPIQCLWNIKLIENYFIVFFSGLFANKVAPLWSMIQSWASGSSNSQDCLHLPPRRTTFVRTQSTV